MAWAERVSAGSVDGGMNSHLQCKPPGYFLSSLPVSQPPYPWSSHLLKCWLQEGRDLPAL